MGPAFPCRGAIPAWSTDVRLVVPTQAPLEVLKDKECPAMLIPSTPRTSAISEELVNPNPGFRRDFSEAVWGFWGSRGSLGLQGGALGRLSRLSRPLLCLASGTEVLPGHRGQEWRHHGGQPDHLRRRPRAPQECHRTAGRGQVSPGPMPLVKSCFVSTALEILHQNVGTRSGGWQRRRSKGSSGEFAARNC